MTMVRFDVLFSDLAKKETRVITALEDPIVPTGDYLLMEAFCVERRCDCRRVMISVVDAARHEQVATINHGFEPPEPPFEDEGQTFLDPLNPQTELSSRFLELFESLVISDSAYRARLERHYAMWKRVVDDPRHPARVKLRSRRHAADGEGFFPARQAPRADESKVGPNAPCPCGSGAKYKKCCQRARA